MMSAEPIRAVLLFGSMPRIIAVVLADWRMFTLPLTELDTVQATGASVGGTKTVGAAVGEGHGPERGVEAAEQQPPIRKAGIGQGRMATRSAKSTACW